MDDIPNNGEENDHLPRGGALLSAYCRIQGPRDIEPILVFSYLKKNLLHQGPSIIADPRRGPGQWYIG